MSDQNSPSLSEAEKDAAAAARQEILVAIARRENAKEGWRTQKAAQLPDLPVIPAQEIREILQDILSHQGKHYIKPFDEEGYLVDAMVKYTSPSRDNQSYLFQRKTMVAQCILMVLMQEMGETCIEGGCSEAPDENGLLELRGHWMRNSPNAMDRLMKETQRRIDAPYEEQLAFANLITKDVMLHIIWEDWGHDEQEVPRAIVADVELERPQTQTGQQPLSKLQHT